MGYPGEDWEIALQVRPGISVLVLLTLLGVSGAPTAARDAKDKKALTIEAAADAAATAAERNDKKRLAALAGAFTPDPWEIVEELVVRERDVVAAALAQAATAKRHGRLASYAEDAIDFGRAAGRQEASRRMAQLANASKWSDVLVATRGHDVTQPDVISVASLLTAANALHSLGRTDEAIDHASRALEIAETIGWLHGQRRARRRLASVAFQKGDFVNCLRLNETVLEAAREVGDTFIEAQALNGMGIAHFRRGALKEAREALHEAVKLYEARAFEINAAGAYINLGNTHAVAKNFEEAIPLFEKGLAICKRIGATMYQFNALNNLASASLVMGRVKEAVDYGEQAVALSADLNDPHPKARAQALLARLARAMGEADTAAARFTEAADLYVKAGDAFHGASCSLDAAPLYINLGRLAAALAATELAIDLGRRIRHFTLLTQAYMRLAEIYLHGRQFQHALKALDRGERARKRWSNAANEAQFQELRGAIYAKMQAWDEAIEAYQRALEGAKATKFHLLEGRILEGLADVEQFRGNLDEANKQYLAALKLATSQKDRFRTFSLKHSLGQVRLLQGDPKGALELLDEALPEAIDMGNRHSESAIRSARAEAYTQLKKWTPALKDIDRSIELDEARFAGLDDDTRVRAREATTDSYSLGARIGILKNDPALLWKYAETGRARSLRDGLAVRARSGSSDVPRKLRIEEAAMRKRVARARIKLAEAREAEDVSKARARKRDLKAATKRHLKALRALQSAERAGAAGVLARTSSLAEVQTTLAPDECYVGYFVAEALVAALVLTTKDRRIVTYPDVEALDRALDAAFPRDPPYVQPKALAGATEALWKPLDLPASVRRAYVSVAGDLSRVPLNACSDGCAVCMVPSGSMIGLLGQERELQGKRVLALGDPNYDAIRPALAASLYSRGTEKGRAGLAPLPATRTEVEQIADVKLLGDDATESEFLRRVKEEKRWRSVHFACHALVNTDEPGRSALAITSDGNNDGYLTAIEVFQQRIPSDLVVLSACESGLGRVVAGEGVLGLTRAFMHAGTPRVICSNWKVDDAATSALMIKFYERWKAAGGDAAAALREAQAHIKAQEKWEHPMYWAAWTLWGVP